MSYRPVLDRQDRMETVHKDYEATADRSPSLYAAHRVPEDEYEALMKAAPLEWPEMTAEEHEADWTLFQLKLDAAGLTEMERIVIDAVVFGGYSVNSQVGIILAQAMGRNKAYSKTHVMRLRDQAFEKLRAVFSDGS